MICTICNSPMFYIGQLGTVHYGTCRGCGMTSIVQEEDLPPIESIDGDDSE